MKISWCAFVRAVQTFLAGCYCCGVVERCSDGDYLCNPRVERLM